MFRAHMLIIRRSKLHYTAYRFDDTRGCVMQFWPPDDEHMCSKHVEAWNKLIVKQKLCASSWLTTEINILRCTVSKTSKLEESSWKLTDHLRMCCYLDTRTTGEEWSINITSYWYLLHQAHPYFLGISILRTWMLATNGEESSTVHSTWKTCAKKKGSKKIN